MAELLELGCIQFIDGDEKPDLLVGRVFAFAREPRREEDSTA